MKWTFVIQQKLKAALLLLGIMILVILFNIIERRNIEAMNRSVNSIYNDRLLPAADIFYLTDNLYSKRSLMEQYLLSENEEHEAFQKSLDLHNKNINNLIHKFEKTYLVDSEVMFLKELKAQINAYSVIERDIIRLSGQNSKDEAELLYHKKGKPVLAATMMKLSELTKIQTKVGGELLNNSKGILANSDLLSSLHLVLTICIGVIIVMLVTASKIVRHTQESFNLN